MNYKNTPINIKDIDPKQGLVTGYASTVNILDDGGDIITPGAFKRTINAWGPEGKKRIKALYMHDPAWMVGRPVRLEEDNVGLYHETQFSTRNSMAKDTLVLIEDGVITEQSIGYDIVNDELDDDGNRLLKELKLYEYSFVAWGMNEFTPITSVKGKESYDIIQTSMDRFEKALRKGHFESEEIPEMIELAVKRWKDDLKVIKDNTKEHAIDIILKEGRVLSASNRKKVEDAVKALQDVLTVDAPSDSDSSKGTQDAGSSHKGDSGDHSPVDEVMKALDKQRNYIKSKQLYENLKEFGKTLRSE